MKLFELTKNLECQIYGDEEIEIEDIVYDSRKVKNGTMFVCLKGENADGHDYIKSAEQKGAKVVVCERKMEVDVTQVVCQSTRKALSILLKVLCFI